MHRALEGRNRGQRDQLAGGAPHIVIQKLIRVEALTPFDLGNHAITAAVVDEAVDVAAPQQGAQIPSDVAEIEAHGSNFIFIDIDLDLG